MKKWLLSMALAAVLLGLTGCTAVEDALGRIGEEMNAAHVETPQNNGGDIDWGFVPLLREKAQETFAAGFPNAEIQDSSVACKNADTRRVIVTLTYTMNGKKGTYGFDYKKNDAGEYELTRYGDGVNADDL